MKRKNGLKSKELFHLLWRSFFIQNVWNYQSYISIGLCFSLTPVAKRLNKKKDDLIKFMYRHLNFFNSHPYFASYALGAITRLEEEQILEERKEYSSIDRLKNALIGPLGAVGDQLVWANIKPACLIMGILCLYVIENLIIEIIALVLVFLLYNLPHFHIRISGLLQGYRMGNQVYKILNLDNFSFLKYVYGAAGAISIGMIIGTSFIKLEQTDISHLVIFIFCMVITYAYRKWKQNYYGCIVFPLLLAIIIGIF
jgi:mannose/fructose/N-acetylgalactosamine-specific phosphotransferase system component IID